MGVKEAMASKPTRATKTKIKESCMTESALHVWFQIVGRKSPSRKIPEEEKR